MSFESSIGTGIQDVGCLISAAVNGNVSKVITYLTSGFYVNSDLTRHKRHRTNLLHLASENGHYDLVRELIARGANVNQMDSDDSSPLQVAVINGYIEIVEALLAAKANPDLASRDGKTPLCLAIENEYLSIAHSLLAAGASTAIKLPNGESMLHVATRCQCIPLIPLLIEQHQLSVRSESSAQETALFIAAKDDCLDSLCELLHHCTAEDINHRHPVTGKTPLLIAIENGNTDIVDVLLSTQGILVNLRSNNGASPLIVAIQGQYPDIIRKLIQAGAKVHEPEVLEAGLKSGSIQVLKSLYYMGLELSDEVFSHASASFNKFITAFRAIQQNAELSLSFNEWKHQYQRCQYNDAPILKSLVHYSKETCWILDDLLLSYIVHHFPEELDHEWAAYRLGDFLLKLSSQDSRPLEDKIRAIKQLLDNHVQVLEEVDSHHGKPLHPVMTATGVFATTHLSTNAFTDYLAGTELF